MKYISHKEYIGFEMQKFYFLSNLDVKVFRGQSYIKWNARCQEALMVKFIQESFIRDANHLQLKLHQAINIDDLFYSVGTCI